MAKEVREETIWKKNGSATVQKTMKTIRTAKYVETTEVSNHQ